MILNNPGAREDRDDHECAFVTRQMPQYALQGVGLPPEDVYVTCLLKCRPLRAYDKGAVRAFSKPFLIRQIKAMQSECMVCPGGIVVQVIFDDKNAHVKDLRGRWHTALGRPCIVSYHPLAIRRRPNLMRLFMEDWGMLARRLHGGVGDSRGILPHMHESKVP